MKKLIIAVLAIGLLALASPGLAGTYDVCVDEANTACVDNGKVRRLCWMETFMQCCAGTELEAEYPQQMKILETVQKANRFVERRWYERGEDWKILRPYPDGQTPVRFKSRWMPETPEDMMEE